jgi:hypothetical protein
LLLRSRWGVAVCSLSMADPAARNIVNAVLLRDNDHVRKPPDLGNPKRHVPFLTKGNATWQLSKEKSP